MARYIKTEPGRWCVEQSPAFKWLWIASKVDRTATGYTFPAKGTVQYCTTHAEAVAYADKQATLEAYGEVGEVGNEVDGYMWVYYKNVDAYALGIVLWGLKHAHQIWAMDFPEVWEIAKANRARRDRIVKQERGGE